MGSRSHKGGPVCPDHGVVKRDLLPQQEPDDGEAFQPYGEELSSMVSAVSVKAS